MHTSFTLSRARHGTIPVAPAVATMDRRRCLQRLGTTIAGIACRSDRDTTGLSAATRLSARPYGMRRTLTPGLTIAYRGTTRIALYVPAVAMEAFRSPLLLVLHENGKDSETGVRALSGISDETGVVLVAPYAASVTWDGLNGRFGTDVQGVDIALTHMFDFFPIDAARVGAAGVTEGAAYALALGCANGDLFSRLIAFSPRLAPEAPTVGKPGIAIAHGTGDRSGAFETTRDVIVPGLRSRGYSVDFTAVEGPGGIDLSVARSEMRRLAGLA